MQPVAQVMSTPIILYYRMGHKLKVDPVAVAFNMIVLYYHIVALPKMNTIAAPLLRSRHAFYTVVAHQAVPGVGHMNGKIAMGQRVVLNDNVFGVYYF